jgi:ribonuclease P protein component
MPKKYRLSRADFSALALTKRRRVSGEYFFLTTAPLPALRASKAACIVSKKVAPRAPARNAIKRRCRAVVRPLLASLKRPRALVFHAKREAAAASFAELKRDIVKLVERA